MYNNNPFYFHFVTDLKRVIFCMRNQNLDGAKAFMDHANKIYETKLKTDSVFKVVAQNFDTAWDTLYTMHLPTEASEQEKFEEQVLTMASIVFMRASHVHETAKNKIQIPS